MTAPAHSPELNEGPPAKKRRTNPTRWVWVGVAAFGLCWLVCCLLVNFALRNASTHDTLLMLLGLSGGSAVLSVGFFVYSCWMGSSEGRRSISRNFPASLFRNKEVRESVAGEQRGMVLVISALPGLLAVFSLIALVVMILLAFVGPGAG